MPNCSLSQNRKTPKFNKEWSNTERGSQTATRRPDPVSDALSQILKNFKFFGLVVCRRISSLHCVIEVKLGPGPLPTHNFTWSARQKVWEPLAESMYSYVLLNRSSSCTLNQLDQLDPNNYNKTTNYLYESCLFALDKLSLHCCRINPWQGGRPSTSPTLLPLNIDCGLSRI